MSRLPWAPTGVKRLAAAAGQGAGLWRRAGFALVVALGALAGGPVGLGGTSLLRRRLGWCLGPGRNLALLQAEEESSPFFE